MKSSYLGNLARMVNEYKSIISKAEMLHQEFLGNPIRSLLIKEMRCYNEACEMCGKIAALFSTKDPQYTEWLGRQATLEHKLRDLVYIHDHGMPEESQADEKIPTVKTAAPGYKPSAKKASTAGTDEIPREMVDKWFGHGRPKHSFTNVVGMEELKNQLNSYAQDVAASSVNEYMKLEKVFSLFLYGPPGCGKTFVTEAFIHEIMDEHFQYEGENYKYMFLSGGDIHQSLVGRSEKVVERAFEEAKANAPCIMFIDEIDSVCRNRSMPHLPTHAMNTTTAFLNGYNNLSKAEKPVIFIGATNYPDLVDAAMLDRVDLFRVPLPDLKLRAHTFRHALQSILRNEDGFTYEDMAEETDNYSQRDCKRLSAKIKRAVINDLKENYSDDSATMIQMMKNGSYRLRREMFMDVLKKHSPSRKEEILRNLDRWDSLQQEE